MERVLLDERRVMRACNDEPFGAGRHGTRLQPLGRTNGRDSCRKERIDERHGGGLGKAYEQVPEVGAQHVRAAQRRKVRVFVEKVS